MSGRSLISVWVIGLLYLFWAPALVAQVIEARARIDGMV